jgi:hypothetical protein
MFHMGFHYFLLLLLASSFDLFYFFKIGDRSRFYTPAMYIGTGCTFLSPIDILFSSFVRH